MEKSIEAMPTYALCYLVNGDPTGLTDDEIQMIFSPTLEQLKGDDVIRRRKIYDVIPFADDEPNGQPYFSSVPFFGMPTEVADCIVMFNY